MLELIVLALSAFATPGTESMAETLLRAAAYDRNLGARTPEGLRLGVVFDPAGADTRAAAENFAAEASGLRAIGSELAPAWVELVAVESEKELYRWVRANHVSVLFVPADMGETVSAVVRASEASGVLTLAGAPEDVARGLVLGVRVNDDTKKLVVNMGAAERTGVDFDAVVRQVAERVGDAPTNTSRDEVQETLVRYRDAIEERDLDALRRVWPALEGEDERRVVASFKIARSHKVAFAVLRVDHHGQQTRARVRRTDTLVTKDGKTIVAGSVVQFSFAKTGDGAWLIDSMSAAGPPS